MGEVYRADDLKLGMAVALKFLPAESGQDASLLERFHAEVRTARQVSHSHVCRVYDIGEVDGRHFLTMEYVDGEDLASLLRRIGRLPPAKAVEIARQLAAGLAAAHEKGVLHRDLKPANVMIDGHGRARITDFGLAVLTNESKAELAGTPAYMAPEQLAGHPATVQSDIYALGLVLYEIFTGKRPFDAASLAEWRSVHSFAPPTSPSLHTADMDPVVERVILRCLEKEPSLRPTAAAQVALALPGGDPLAAALAAGETPSPEMVAAAGGEGALSPARAWAALGVFCAFLFALILISPGSTDLGLAPMERSPDALADRAREMVNGFGYTEPPMDEVTWLRRDYSPIRWLADHAVSTEWRHRLRQLGAPVILQYRRSDSPLLPLDTGSRVTMKDPAPDPGDIQVAVDSRGRLRQLIVTPQLWSSPRTGDLSFPEEAVFRETGLERDRFEFVPPECVPPVPFDDRREWRGTRAQAPDMELHLSAATFEGRLTFVSILGPWDRRGAIDPLTGSVTTKISGLATAILTILICIAGFLLTRRNLRLARGDKRGSFRVGVAGFLLSMAIWAVSFHPARDLARLLSTQLLPAMGRAAFEGGFLWLIYMSLEPIFRRRMPDLLVGWARVLDGKFRDPRVGRDVLLGLVLGALLATGIHLVNGLPTWFPFPSQTTIPSFSTGPRMIPLAAPFTAASNAITRTLAGLMLLFGLRLVTTRNWVAILGLTVIFALFGLGGENPALEIPDAILSAAVVAIALVRLGPLTVGVMWFACIFLETSPVRANPSLWYAPHTVATLALVIGMALWAFRTSLGGRPAFRPLSLDG
jgi:serine/threonine-protein kinase